MAGGGLEDGGCGGPRRVHLILPFLLPVCECHLQGSLSTECAPLGGQCPCRPNITGRTCDRCLPGTFGLRPTGCRGELSGPWVWGLGPACHFSTWLDRPVTSQSAAATPRGLPVPSVTLRVGSARVGQAALVAAVTAASLAGGASHAASPVPAMDTPSCATHSQASARTAAEPPQAGIVRGEAALEGLGRGQDEGLGPRSTCHCPQVLGRLLWRPHPGLRPAVPALPLSWAPWLRPLSWDLLPCGQHQWTCPVPLCPRLYR